MSRALIFMFLSTFVVGFAAGFNVFLNTREALPSLPTTNLSQGYDITYDVYGACRTTGCVSYRITHDGTATQIITRNGAQVARRDGKLSDAAQKDVVTKLKASSLTVRAQKTCTPQTGQSEARVTIRIGETTYRYDTCLEALPEPLGSYLHNYVQWLQI